MPLQGRKSLPGEAGGDRGDNANTDIITGCVVETKQASGLNENRHTQFMSATHTHTQHAVL